MDAGRLAERGHGMIRSHAGHVTLLKICGYFFLFRRTSSQRTLTSKTNLEETISLENIRNH